MMVSAMEKNKKRDGVGFAILNGMVKEDFIEKLTFMQRSERGEGKSYVGI